MEESSYPKRPPSTATGEAGTEEAPPQDPDEIRSLSALTGVYTDSERSRIFLETQGSFLEQSYHREHLFSTSSSPVVTVSLALWFDQDIERASRRLRAVVDAKKAMENLRPESSSSVYTLPF